MKPTLAIILRHNNPLSHEYAAKCAESCDKVGIEWEYFNGYSNMTGKAAWMKTGIPMKFNEEYRYMADDEMLDAHKANCASAGHGGIWKKIAEHSKHESFIILEHDGLLLNPVDIDIPDYKICVLGYKMKDPENYNHAAAGSPTDLIDIDGHEGAHAYAITKNTAKVLVAEIEGLGVLGAVDNAYFIRGQRRTRVPLCIASPPPAVGWLRESTIWKGGSADRNYRFIDSFDRHYRQGRVVLTNK